MHAPVNAWLLLCMEGSRSIHQPDNCLGCGAMRLGFDVGVVGGHGLVGVAEGLAADLGVYFSVASEGGAGVAAAFVELDHRDACGLGEGAEPTVDVVRGPG